MILLTAALAAAAAGIANVLLVMQIGQAVDRLETGAAAQGRYADAPLGAFATRG